MHTRGCGVGKGSDRVRATAVWLPLKILTWSGSEWRATNSTTPVRPPKSEANHKKMRESESCAAARGAGAEAGSVKGDTRACSCAWEQVRVRVRAPYAAVSSARVLRRKQRPGA